MTANGLLHITRDSDTVIYRTDCGTAWVFTYDGWFFTRWETDGGEPCAFHERHQAVSFANRQANLRQLTDAISQAPDAVIIDALGMLRHYNPGGYARLREFLRGAA